MVNRIIPIFRNSVLTSCKVNRVVRKDILFMTTIFLPKEGNGVKKFLIVLLALKMEAGCFSETLVFAYKTIWCHKFEDHNLNDLPSEIL
jgi:hypothetical protein